MLRPTVGSGLIISWAGMRGIVTLAAALALPAAFPFRDLIVLTAFFGRARHARATGTDARPSVAQRSTCRTMTRSDAKCVPRAKRALQRRAGQRSRTTGSPVADAVRQEFIAHLGSSDADPEEGEARRSGPQQTFTAERCSAARQAVHAMRASNEIGDDAFHLMEEDLDWIEMAGRLERRVTDAVTLSGSPGCSALSQKVDVIRGVSVACRRSPSVASSAPRSFVQLARACAGRVLRSDARAEAAEGAAIGVELSARHRRAVAGARRRETASPRPRRAPPAIERGMRSRRTAPAASRDRRSPPRRSPRRSSHRSASVTALAATRMSSGRPAIVIAPDRSTGTSRSQRGGRIHRGEENLRLFASRGRFVRIAPRPRRGGVALEEPAGGERPIHGAGGVGFSPVGTPPSPEGFRSSGRGASAC